MVAAIAAVALIFAASFYLVVAAIAAVALIFVTSFYFVAVTVAAIAPWFDLFLMCGRV